MTRKRSNLVIALLASVALAGPALAQNAPPDIGRDAVDLSDRLAQPSDPAVYDTVLVLTTPTAPTGAPSAAATARTAPCWDAAPSSCPRRESATRWPRTSPAASPCSAR